MAVNEFNALADALPPMSTPKTLADILGISPNTLAYWRATGNGPAYVKAGKIVMYAKEDVLDYMTNNRRTITKG